MVRLELADQIFTLRCSFNERHLPREAGFKWSTEKKIWYTKSVAVAARLREHAIGEAKSFFKNHLINISPWTAPLPPPPAGLQFLPHQTAALEFALSRDKCYLALDMRLGKSVVAATVMRARKLPTVIICPPFLISNWETELERWAPDFSDWVIIGDSMLAKLATTRMLENKFGDAPEKRLIVDEGHRFKNLDAQRTRALFGHKAAPRSGLVHQFSRLIFLSGTPMPNRPIELFPLLSTVAPETIDFMGYWDFGRRYCNGRKGEFGWDFTGASNVPELARKVIHPSGPFMLRQRRELVDLPPVTEEIFVVSADLSPAVADMDVRAREALGGEDDVIKAALTPANTAELHLATYRRLLGAQKATAVLPYLEYLLDETDESLLIFAHHKEVVAALATQLERFSPYVVTAATKPDARANVVANYQHDTERRALIGNIAVMGMGLDCSRADRVIFVEFDWVPGVNDQAAARALKLGKKSSVYVQYVVYKDSLDKKVVEALLRKRKSLAHI